LMYHLFYIYLTNYLFIYLSICFPTSHTSPCADHLSPCVVLNKAGYGKTPEVRMNFCITLPKEAKRGTLFTPRHATRHTTRTRY
jgi:hypothetical protein